MVGAMKSSPSVGLVITGTGPAGAVATLTCTVDEPVSPHWFTAVAVNAFTPVVGHFTCTAHPTLVGLNTAPGSSDVQVRYWHPTTSPWAAPAIGGRAAEALA